MEQVLDIFWLEQPFSCEPVVDLYGEAALQHFFKRGFEVEAEDDGTFGHLGDELLLRPALPWGMAE